MSACVVGTVAEPAAGGLAMDVVPLTAGRPHPDPESLAMVHALSGTGPAHDAAVERLHALLLRAAHFELGRRGRVHDRDELARQSADDALLAILRKLHTYRGDSRFTTWAYKFALLEAAVKVRKRAWHGREVPLEADGWARLADRRTSPDADAESAELISAV